MSILFPVPPITRTVLLERMVTEAKSHVPATQVKAPLMTLLPTRLPASCQVLVPVTVPLRLKLPMDRTVTPWLLVVI